MSSGEVLGGLGVLAGLAYWLFQRGQAAAEPTTPPPTTRPGMHTPVPYSPRLLSKAQQLIADKILAAAQGTRINPAFMLALALTESSLRPTVTGDDGISIGLFQLQLGTARDHRPHVTEDDLRKADLNIEIALLEMRRLMTVYPGFPLSDYAEAWTLGGRGRFVNQKRNWGKLVNMHQAITDLDLSLSLKEVAT